MLTTTLILFRGHDCSFSTFNTSSSLFVWLQESGQWWWWWWWWTVLCTYSVDHSLILLLHLFEWNVVSIQSGQNASCRIDIYAYIHMCTKPQRRWVERQLANQQQQESRWFWDPHLEVCEWMRSLDWEGRKEGMKEWQNHITFSGLVGWIGGFGPSLLERRYKVDRSQTERGERKVMWALCYHC